MKLRIVLVGTSHPGNLGSVARAMKTMGLSELYLVAPEVLPNEKSQALATNAKDVLAAAKIVSSLPEAVLGCDRVVGTSTRPRAIDSITRVLRDSMLDLVQNFDTVAMVFGRENSGLTNFELDLCDEQIYIPANSDFSSLNLAQAVQVICYEYYSNIHATSNLTLGNNVSKSNLASHAEFQGMIDHLEQVMLQVEYLNKDEPRFLMRRMKHLFTRASLDSKEVNIMRGFLAKIQKTI